MLLREGAGAALPLLFVTSVSQLYRDEFLLVRQYVDTALVADFYAARADDCWQ